MYTALYRKYRSQTFDEILGQDNIATILSNQVKSGNISHAYLFSGTRGTGKTSCAKILARGINCLHPVNGSPCNECESCKGIMDGSYMDVVEMDAASNNGVDDIRDLKEKVYYPPANLKYKVYIIDEVHMLSKGAFNALLKILEEPPRHLVFILATTEPERIPATILSRCQRFNFRRISKDVIEKNLKKITEEEGKSCDEKIYKLIANKAQGAMRDALSLLDQVLSYGEDISYEDALSILGIASEDEILNLALYMLKGDLEQSFALLSKIVYSGKDPLSIFKDLILVLRDALVYLVTSKDLDLTGDYERETFEKFRGIDIGLLYYAIDVLSKKSEDAKYAFDQKVLLELAIIEIKSSFMDIPVREQIVIPKSAPVEAENTPEDLTSDVPLSAEEENEEPEEVEGMFIQEENSNVEPKKTVESMEELYRELNLNDFKESLESPILQSMIGYIEDFEIENNDINFLIKDKFQMKLLKQNESELKSALSEFMKKDMEIKFTLRTLEEKNRMNKVYDLFGKENVNIN